MAANGRLVISECFSFTTKLENKTTTVYQFCTSVYSVSHAIYLLEDVYHRVTSYILYMFVILSKFSFIMGNM